MEKVKKIVTEIAYSQDFSKLSPLHRSLIPLLSAASFLYSLSLTIRKYLYHFAIFPKHRLPVAVISVGNLTWGGNGKTPMVEYLSLWLSRSGVTPLILSRGYAGGDEVRMLERHFFGTSVKVGIGANRTLAAAWFLERCGCVNFLSSDSFKRLRHQSKVQTSVNSDKIGAVVLDDGMQHVSLSRDLEIVMVNGLRPWGNNQLLPLGPLREPLYALERADVVVIHHADLVSEQELPCLKRRIQDMKAKLPVFFSILAPSHFFTIHNLNAKIPLSAVRQRVLLSISAIGSPDAFVKCIEKLGPSHIDHLHYSDHYSFQLQDIKLIKKRLEDLWQKYDSKPAVVTTEKDYDRDCKVLMQLHPFEVLVLNSQLKVMPYCGSSEEGFKELLLQLLHIRLKCLEAN